MSSRKLRVLVIDDSAYNRQIITDVLGAQPDFEIVGKADDGEQGLKLAASLKPDLITLDIEMPRMDGFTFLRLLMSQLPTPVIVISSHSKKQEVFQALELGALDFVAKPQRFLQPEVQNLKDDIVAKARAVQALQIIPFSKRTERARTPGEDSAAAAPSRKVAPKPVTLQRVVCIGASTGGPPALQSLLKVMNPASPCAILISQHMPEKFTKAFAERLNRVSPLEVSEAEDGVPVLPGHAYVAPGGAHLELAEDRSGLKLRLVKTVPDDHYVPSIDRLFASAAAQKTARVMAVVLTGMGADGKEGIQRVQAAGGRTVAESQESAIVFGMPKEAIQTGCVQDILALEVIIERVQAFASDARF